MAPERFEEMELVKRVTLSSGQVMDVRMPFFIDIVPFIGKPDFIYQVLCVAVNMTNEEMSRVNYVDGLALLTPLGDFQSALKTYGGGPMTRQ